MKEYILRIKEMWKKPVAGRKAWGGVLIATVIIASFLFSSKDTPLSFLERNEEGTKTENLLLSGTYGDVTVTREITVTLNKREETGEEKIRNLEEAADALISAFSVTEEGRPVLTDIVLPEEINGYKLLWTSDRPDLLDGDGKLYPESIQKEWEEQGREEPIPLVLSVLVLDDGRETERKIPIEVSLPRSNEETERYLEGRLENWRNWIRGEADDSLVFLDSETEEGILLSWKRKGKAVWKPVLLLLPFSLFCLWIGKKRKGLAKQKEEKRIVSETLPGFLDELILMLRAGLIPETAMKRIAEFHKEDANPFYTLLEDSRDKSNTGNTPFLSTFRTETQRMGLPVLLRFTGIMEDAIRNGTDAVEKLETEASLLRGEKNRKTEEKGRLAETKLLFPMLLLLGSLLLVTLAPVLSELD